MSTLIGKVALYLFIVLAVTVSSWGYGELQFQRGVRSTEAEYAEAVSTRDAQIADLFVQNTALALDVKAQESKLEQTNKANDRQVAKYVSVQQKNTIDCNLSCGNVWLLNANAAGSECTDIEDCARLSFADAQAASAVGPEQFLQWANRTVTYCNYAINRHNTLVKAITAGQHTNM
jgi:hypothetical protein